LVSGFFGPREKVWEEPIYRNVWGQLREWGDAEIIRLVVPRYLHIEASEVPTVTSGPGRPGRQGAAPGKIDAVHFKAAIDEWARAGKWFEQSKTDFWKNKNRFLGVLDNGGKPKFELV